MSITVVSSSKVYASIEDLSENMGISNGDRFLIQTDGGTMLFDYENLKIDLEHTTFGTAFSDLQQFQSTVSDFVTQITEEFTTAQSDIALLRSDVDTVQSQLQSIKLMLKLIMGYQNGGSEDGIELNRQQLPTEGQEFMAEIYGGIRDEIDADFSLTTNNLMNIQRAVTLDDGASVADTLETMQQNLDAQDSVIADLGASISCIKDIMKKSYVTEKYEDNIFGETGNVLSIPPSLTRYVGCVANNAENAAWFTISKINRLDNAFFVMQGGWITGLNQGNPYILFHIPFKHINYVCNVQIQMKNRYTGSTKACAHKNVWIAEKQLDKMEISLETQGVAYSTHLGYFDYNWMSMGVCTRDACVARLKSDGVPDAEINEILKN